MGNHRQLSRLLSALVLAWLLGLGSVAAAEIFLRVRVVEPAAGEFRVTTGGHRHHGTPSWYLPSHNFNATAGLWSEWQDLREWPIHDRAKRIGGLAEWPSMKLTLTATGKGMPKVEGCRLEVQLASAPKDEAVVLQFEERGASATIAFLLVHPLASKASEFETGSQMTARHLAWAEELTGGQAPLLRKFDLATSIWGHYDPELAKQAVRTLRLLGFNTLNGAPNPTLREAGMRVLGKTWVYGPDPDSVRQQMQAFRTGPLAREMATEEGQWFYANMAHLVISDEIKALDLRGVAPDKLNGWYRAWLAEQRVTAEYWGGDPAQAVYPAAAMVAKTLPKTGSLHERRQLYLAARFGQVWSARQLRLTTDLLKEAIPGAKTETLPSSHGFFDAWGPPHIGMSYCMLDLFELGAGATVDVLSSEDWLGLNHMYGGNYTWTGAQTLEWQTAIMRSGIGEHPVKLMALITPSDDGYLRLKAYSSLAQGVRAFFFWTFGPTYIGTENYWSDLRSQYVGLVKLNRALVQAEDLLLSSRPVRDPVAMLYSVSHDYWHSDQPAAFVEKRLQWHALRHEGWQPDWLREDDLVAGRLAPYKVLYVADWCVSRAAGAAIEAWVQAGGTLALSAGAASRDEAYEPHLPPFAAAVWSAPAVHQLVPQPYRYNERRDLPGIPALTQVRDATPGAVDLPALGQRLAPLRTATGASVWAGTFADNQAAAGVQMPWGKGRICALGYMPGLAYGQQAGFKPSTLAEKWPPAPRAVLTQPLALAGLQPRVSTDVPVVEASLLQGPKGAVLVLANYTYQPVAKLTVQIRAPLPPLATVKSTEGVAVEWRQDATGVQLTLPLEWTDLLLLQPK